VFAAAFVVVVVAVGTDVAGLAAVVAVAYMGNGCCCCCDIVLCDTGILSRVPLCLHLICTVAGMRELFIDVWICCKKLWRNVVFAGVMRCNS
jgi:hypothetical protein